MLFSLILTTLLHFRTAQATEVVIPVKGICFVNATHWGDDFGIQKLPPCWNGTCQPGAGFETIALETPCSEAFDTQYNRYKQRQLVRDHCYPSNRGELSGRQCCGGYKICAHYGENKKYFNVINFFTFRNMIVFQPWFANDDLL